jgi:hypothetical protein
MSAEKSFSKEVELLRLGEGEEFYGEAIRPSRRSRGG